MVVNGHTLNFKVCSAALSAVLPFSDVTLLAPHRRYGFFFVPGDVEMAVKSPKSTSILQKHGNLRKQEKNHENRQKKTSRPSGARKKNGSAAVILTLFWCWILAALKPARIAIIKTVPNDQCGLVRPDILVRRLGGVASQQDTDTHTHTHDII